MKRSILIATGLALTLITGCVVNSVYPFYTAQEEVFDPALAGTWVDSDAAKEAKDYWQIDQSGAKGYLLANVENDQTNHFEAHLFRLKENTFLDLCPTNRVESQLPLHFLLKIEQAPNSFQFQMLDLEWLSKLLDKEPNALRHILIPENPGNTNSLQLVLTADTAELQKFILTHISDTNAFTSKKEMKRRERL